LGIAELQEASSLFIPILKARQMAESAQTMTEEDREHEMARIMAERRRQKEAQRLADAGRPADDFDAVDEPEAEDIDTDDAGDGEAVEGRDEA
jgi:hypothetical protein